MSLASPGGWTSDLQRSRLVESTESGGADDLLVNLQMRFLLLAWDGGAQFEKHQLWGSSSIPEFLA